MRKKWFLMAVAVGALLAHPAIADKSEEKSDKKAQEEVEGEEEGEVEAIPYVQNNSPFCGFTYYSNESDGLDFRGSLERRCFDMKGGDDVLILNRAAFPAGVEIHTGTGRDTVWATDFDDLIYDPDGESKEIRTYNGNDRVEINTPIDEDPFRGIKTTSRTELNMGPGNNRLVFGKGIEGNAVSRMTPDIWMTTASRARDEVEATCGHPTASGNYDIRSLEVPERSSVSYKADGCHIGIFGLYGDADLDMIGGRLALKTYVEGFRIGEGKSLPIITGRAAGGLSLMMDLDKVSPESDFTWEGQGTVFVRSRISDPESGGNFRLYSDREIHYQGDVSPAHMNIQMAAQSAVKLDLIARSGGGNERFTMAGSRMDISWRLAGAGGFPEIINDETITYSQTRYFMPSINWETIKMTNNIAAWDDIEEPDIMINAKVPAEPQYYESIQQNMEVKPGNTRLRLILRRDNDRFGKCVNIRVIDHDGYHDEISGSCVALSDPVQSITIKDASDYESIEISGDGVSVDIPINAASRFNVKRLEVDF